MNLAEREGFEPSIRFHVYTLSRRAPSTTRTSLQIPPPGRHCEQSEAILLGSLPSASCLGRSLGKSAAFSIPAHPLGPLLQVFPPPGRHCEQSEAILPGSSPLLRQKRGPRKKAAIITKREQYCPLPINCTNF